MMKWKLGAVLVVFLLMSPIILLNVWGIRMTLWMGAEEQFLTELKAGNTTADQAPEIPTSPMQWFSDRKELKSAFNLEGMNKERVMSIRVDLTMEDFLGDGEEMPEADLFALYAAARAPGYLMRFCPDILDSMTSKCTVISSDVNASEDGTVRLSGELTYLPAYDLGLPENEGGYELLTRQGARTGTRKLMVEFSAPSRIEFLEQAVENCELLRQEFGNCILSRILFRAKEWSQPKVQSAPQTSTPLGMISSAQYSIFAPKTPETTLTFNKIVEGFGSS